MIPKQFHTIKKWREFEEKSTYEYAHAEVKALKTSSPK
jgi:beta-galactosidase GanA